MRLFCVPTLKLLAPSDLEEGRESARRARQRRRYALNRPPKRQERGEASPPLTTPDPMLQTRLRRA